MTKTVLVTGTATGIGRAVVERFSRAGWNVVATVRKDSDLAVHDHLVGVKTVIFDVDDEQAAPTFAVDAIRLFGRIDALVNNAGYCQLGPLETSTMDQIHRQYQTNFFGLVSVTKAFIPSFREQGAGCVINIASHSGEQGYPYTSVYASSKAAVITLSESLNIELGPLGIVVKAVLPGLHATEIFSKVDSAISTIEAYAPHMTRYFANKRPTGSNPSVTADVVYAAATDTKDTTVRYYSGPEAVAIPRAKRILGPDGYWDEFRLSIVDEASPIFKALIPSPGPVPFDMDLPL